MYFEEFYVGQRFEVDPVTLTEQEIDEFAKRYDPQPIHIDPDFANRGFFHGVIASGLHTLSAVWGEWIKSNRFGTEIIGGTGLDFVNWRKPVRPGDTLYTKAEVTDTIPSPRGKRGQVVIHFKATNQHGEEVLETQCRAYLKGRMGQMD